MNKPFTVLMALALLAAAETAAHARQGEKVRRPLTATGVDPDASGRATLTLKAASDGQFLVQVHKLDRDATFELIVGGVHVADLVTNGGGGKVRFRTRPRGHDLALGFDPRGRTIVVRSANGDDVLDVDFPEDQPGVPGEVVCCIPDDDGAECEDRTADECTAQGGSVVAGATSCLPNPCEGAPPVGGDIVCCIPDDSGPECEDRTQAECMAEGGTVVQATSCAPNPCAPAPPAEDEVVCCLPDNGGDGPAECEDRTATECTAAGGTVSDATSCTPDPCNAVPPAPEEIACCVPHDSSAECEDRTPDECAAQGGTPAPTGTCVPDPCSPATAAAPYYGGGGDDGGHNGGSGRSGGRGRDG
jgi:hypothetical protein